MVGRPSSGASHHCMKAEALGSTNGEPEEEPEVSSPEPRGPGSSTDPSASASAIVQPSSSQALLLRPMEHESITRATSAGISALRKLSGEIACVPRSSPLDVPGSQFYVLVRGHAGCSHFGITEHWAQLKTHLIPPSATCIAPSSIFHSFPTRVESAYYWREVFGSGSSESIPCLPCGCASSAQQ